MKLIDWRQARGAGAMRAGFSWLSRFRCGGYTSRGKHVACGVIFETEAGNPAARCENCRAAHNREWRRLRRKAKNEN